MCECLLIPIKLMHQQLYTRTRTNMTEIKAQHFHIGFGRTEITPLVTLRIRDPLHYIKEPGDPQLVIRSKINRMRGQQIYTEPSSQRANFSPFTKDYRELGLSCEQLQFLSSGLPDLSTKQKKLLYTIISPFLSFPLLCTLILRSISPWLHFAHNPMRANVYCLLFPIFYRTEASLINFSFIILNSAVAIAFRILNPATQFGHISLNFHFVSYLVHNFSQKGEISSKFGDLL